MGNKRIAISQSNYVPWRGYFDLIRSVDEFVLYDEVQYTRRDWRNRNQIRTTHGLHWLTVPVKVKGRRNQTVRETEISDDGWAEAHWRTIQESYARAPGRDDVLPAIASAYRDCSELVFLSEINRTLLEMGCRLLGITTPMRWSSEYRLDGDRSERLLNVCLQAGADRYLSGPAARTYLDEDLFREAGVRVEWMDYEGYREYPQIHGGFAPRVSILDLLMNVGNRAPEFISKS